MNLLVLADSLWNWGGIVLSLCIIAKLVEMDTRISMEDEIQRLEDKYNVTRNS